MAALATLSQSAIAASSTTFSEKSSSLGSSPNSFKIADKAVIINNNALTVGSAQCWNEFKYGRYGVKKSEKKLKLQTGDVIRISRGSEAARLYADILEKMDIL